MNKIVFLIGGLIILGVIATLMLNNKSANTQNTNQTGETNNQEQAQMEKSSASVVSPGTYTVDAADSEFNWSAKKPLIDGYVNSGTIAVSEGTITVGDNEASGTFTLDMNKLQVGLTAKKPGQETTLEGHLKGERWFDVATYPTAEFVITKVEPTSSSDTTFEYTVTGELTMKGETNEISFPAHIYEAEDGLLHAEAQTEIDRTKWGITAGSGNFFENLGDNMISDMIAISFDMVATPTN